MVKVQQQNLPRAIELFHKVPKGRELVISFHRSSWRLVGILIVQIRGP